MVTTVRSAPGVDRLAALRQRDRRNMHRIMEIEAGEIDRDRLRDCVGRGHDLDRVQHQIERAALLQARRGLAVDDMDRHADPHPRSGRQTQEVDMHRPVGDDVELAVARQHALLASLQLEFENGGQEMPGENVPVDFLEVDRDRLGLQTAAIDDGGNAAFATNGAGGPLACPAARHGRELFDRCHEDVLVGCSRPASRGVGTGAKRRLIGEAARRGKRTGVHCLGPSLQVSGAGAGGGNGILRGDDSEPRYDEPRFRPLRMTLIRAVPTGVYRRFSAPVQSFQGLGGRFTAARKTEAACHYPLAGGAGDHSLNARQSKTDLANAPLGGERPEPFWRAF